MRTKHLPPLSRFRREPERLGKRCADVDAYSVGIHREDPQQVPEAERLKERPELLRMVLGDLAPGARIAWRGDRPHELGGQGRSRVFEPAHEVVGHGLRVNVSNRRLGAASAHGAHELEAEHAVAVIENRLTDFDHAGDPFVGVGRLQVVGGLDDVDCV